MSALRCTDPIDGVSYLVADYRVLCDDAFLR